jgi:hypothetical protein
VYLHDGILFSSLSYQISRETLTYHHGRRRQLRILRVAQERHDLSQRRAGLVLVGKPATHYGDHGLSSLTVGIPI